ncbi:MAG: hypothetical protein ACK5LJ_09520 [Paracoccus sp. (in: a-proteobacteria)]
MCYGLVAFAYMRRHVRIPINSAVLRAFKLAADLLSPFGTGRGGMSVMVSLEHECRWWRLLAEDSDGRLSRPSPAASFCGAASCPSVPARRWR